MYQAHDMAVMAEHSYRFERATAGQRRRVSRPRRTRGRHPRPRHQDLFGRLVVARLLRGTHRTGGTTAAPAA